jgi:anti-sigma regulatory factor (Ser/Thr protein kinase)
VPPRRVHARFAPTAATPGRAREMVTQACREWDVEHLTSSAALIVSELVSNAVQHAGTDLVVTARFRGAHLRLSVRDDSSQAAAMVHDDGTPAGAMAVRGRGLRLVDMYATSWGSHAVEGGKIVWATLRAVSPGDR